MGPCRRGPWPHLNVLRFGRFSRAWCPGEDSNLHACYSARSNRHSDSHRESVLIHCASGQLIRSTAHGETVRAQRAAVGAYRREVARARSPTQVGLRRTIACSSTACSGCCDPGHSGTSCPSDTENGRACTSASPAGRRRASGSGFLHELTSDPKNEYLMLDATLVRAHQQAATGKGGAKRGLLRTRLWGVPEVD